MVIGKDVMVNIKEMKHAMMDQKIDRAEEQVVHKLHQDPLNPPAFTPSCMIAVLSAEFFFIFNVFHSTAFVVF